MKALFLDIDDVLCSLKTVAATGQWPHDFKDPNKFDQHALALLRKLGDAGVVFVLSSTWRMHFTPPEAAAGLNLPIVDCTPASGSGFRGSEIAEWLSENPQVTHYAILDDSDDMLDEQTNNFVHVTGEDGMRLRDFRALCQILDVSYESLTAPKGPFMRHANGEEPM